MSITPGKWYRPIGSNKFHRAEADASVGEPQTAMMAYCGRYFSHAYLPGENWPELVRCQTCVKASRQETSGVVEH